MCPLPSGSLCSLIGSIMVEQTYWKWLLGVLQCELLPVIPLSFSSYSVVFMWALQSDKSLFKSRSASSSCVIWGKLSNFFEPQFSLLERMMIVPISWIIVWTKLDNKCKVAQCLAQNKHSINIRYYYSRWYLGNSWSYWPLTKGLRNRRFAHVEELNILSSPPNLSFRWVQG